MDGREREGPRRIKVGREGRGECRRKKKEGGGEVRRIKKRTATKFNKNKKKRTSVIKRKNVRIDLKQVSFDV